MAGLYLDTSALGRVLLGEPDAETIRDALAGYDTWWSSALLAVELRRLARREGLEALADRLLANVRLADVDRASLDRRDPCVWRRSWNRRGRSPTASRARSTRRRIADPSSRRPRRLTNT